MSSAESPSWSGRDPVKNHQGLPACEFAFSELASAMSLHVCSLLGENKAILLDRFDHDCFHLYSLQSRYDLGTNFPMFLNLSNSRDIFP